MKSILFCLRFNITDNRPYAVRVLTIAKMYRELGYNVIFICVDNTNLQREFTHTFYCDFECYTIHFFKTRNPLKLYKTKRFVKQQFSTIMSLIKEKGTEIHSIIALLMYDLIANFSRKYAKKNKIHFIYITTEWYLYHSFYGKFIWLKYLVAVYMRNVKSKNTNIMVISRFLADFYQTKKHCHVSLIPSIVDQNDYAENEMNHQARMSGKIRIMYAGYPGKKDVIHTFFQAILSLSEEERKKIAFYGYGFEEKDLTSLGLSIEEVHQSGCIHICGQVSQKEVKDALNISDFSILIREDTLNAKGGFSTKIVESMMAGVPIIGNLTGDMELYFNDKNSVILSDPSLEECKKALQKVLMMSDAEIAEMKKAAHQTAIQSFDYHLYLETMQKFMEELK